MNERAPASRPSGATAPAGPHAAFPGRGETALAALLFAVGLAQRALLVLHHRVNSDEPQHLHVAWGWTQGLLPYRDVFDNHSPLFSLLMSPLVAMAGERPDIVPLMRLAMVPMVAAGLLAAWFIARRLFSPRVALWTVAIAAINPEFVRASVEYRTDQLWLALWLASLAVLVGGRFTRGRAFASGVLFGLTIATSMKTGLLLTALALAAATSLALLVRRGSAPGGRWLGSRALAVLGGVVIAPGLLVAWFAAHGAWHALLYGVAWHNVVPGLGLWRNEPFRPLIVVAAVPVLALIAIAMLRGDSDPRRGARRATLLVGTALAHACIEGLWPLVTRADLLPLVPVYALFAAALFCALPGAVRDRWPRARTLAAVLAWLPALAVAAESVLAWSAEPALADGTRTQYALLDQVLRITRPGDVLMDAKGETVFRRRVYFLGVETITEERFRLGLNRDDIAQKMIAARTPVCVRQGAVAFPPGAGAFMDTAYVMVGPDVRVLGRVLDPVAGSPGTPRAFSLPIAQRYAVTTPRGAARGRLDGAPYAGPRDLAAGPHVYEPAPGERRVAVLWADAVARGAVPLAFRAAAVTVAAGARAANPLVPTGADRLLVIAPHPDDESMATGGLIERAIAAGARVRVLHVTDGDRNPWSQLVHEHRWPFTAADRARWGALRRREGTAAMVELGVDTTESRWLGLPDQGITDLLASGDPGLADTLAAEIRRWRPTVIAAPSLFDHHPDHNAIAVELGLALDHLAGAAGRPAVLAYRVHTAGDDPEPTLWVTLDGPQRERKRVAIEQHHSQLHWHPHEMFDFAQPLEGYDLLADDIGPPEPRALHDAYLASGALVVDFSRGRPFVLGPLLLRVVLQGPGENRRFALVLPARPGELPLVDVVARRGLPPARLGRTGKSWRVTLPAAAVGAPTVCWVKLERPQERAWGFFDGAGWWPARAESRP